MMRKESFVFQSPSEKVSPISLRSFPSQRKKRETIFFPPKTQDLKSRGRCGGRRISPVKRFYYFA